MSNDEGNEEGDEECYDSVKHVVRIGCGTRAPEDLPETCSFLNHASDRLRDHPPSFAKRA